MYTSYTHKHTHFMNLDGKKPESFTNKNRISKRKEVYLIWTEGPAVASSTFILLCLLISLSISCLSNTKRNRKDFFNVSSQIPRFLSPTNHKLFPLSSVQFRSFVLCHSAIAIFFIYLCWHNYWAQLIWKSGQSNINRITCQFCVVPFSLISFFFDLNKKKSVKYFIYLIVITYT